MAPKIPLADLEAQLASIRDELLAALTRCVDSGRYLLGPEVERLEKGIAEVCGVAHAVGASSGTDALLMSLMALGVGPGDEVVTTAYSFFATAGVVARCYPVPLPLQPCFTDLGHGPGDFPEAERAARETLALPMFPELTDDRQRASVSILAR